MRELFSNRKVSPKKKAPDHISQASEFSFNQHFSPTAETCCQYELGLESSRCGLGSFIETGQKCDPIRFDWLSFKTKF